MSPMASPRRAAARGFLIIEALVALLVLSLGVLGMTSLMGHVTGAAGESKARSEALAMARTRLDSLRNNLQQVDYEGRLPVGACPDTPRQVDGIAYTLRCRIVDAYPPLGLVRKVEVEVEWVNRAGQTQRVTLDSALAWNDPVRSVRTTTSNSASVVRPSGGALRGTAAYSPGAITSVVTDADKTTRLRITANDGTILYLKPDAAGNAQQFTTISGSVLFDAAASNLPSPQSVHLRLSSEGQCVYDNLSGSVQLLPAGSSEGSAKYRYFTYTCYVGPGWYGNVGVQLPETSTPPTVCVGDPAVSDTSRTTNPAWTESTIRAYRGFREATINGTTTFITTGMAARTTTLAYGDTPGVTVHGGSPVPSVDFPAIYNPVPAGSDFFKQDFLVSRISGTQTCAQRMSLINGTFTRNAGKNFCIRPDNWTTDTTGNRCPAQWPGTTGAGACSIQISGSFNPPRSTTQAETTISYATSTGDSGICQGQGNSANYACTLTGGASTTVTITARVAGRVSGSMATQTCVRSLGNVGCSSISGFNIDSGTATCTQSGS